MSASSAATTLGAGGHRSLGREIARGRRLPRGRTRAGARRGHRGQHVGGHGHDLGRGAVVDREAFLPPPAADVGVEHLGPGAGAGRAAPLGHVADHGQRPGGDAPHHHPPGHRGQLLRLVDDHVAVGPGGVGPGAFGGGELLAGVAVPVGQGGGVHQTALGYAGDLQHLAGVPLLGPALPVRGPAPPLVGRVVAAEQLGRFVQQRDVGHGPRVGGVRAGQHGSFGRRKSRGGAAEGAFVGQQAGDQPLRGQVRPQVVERGADRRLVPQPGAGVRAGPRGPGRGRGRLPRPRRARRAPR